MDKLSEKDYYGPAQTNALTSDGPTQMEPIEVASHEIAQQLLKMPPFDRAKALDLIKTEVLKTMHSEIEGTKSDLARMKDAFNMFNESGRPMENEQATQ